MQDPVCSDKRSVAVDESSLQKALLHKVDDPGGR